MQHRGITATKEGEKKKYAFEMLAVAMATNVSLYSRPSPCSAV